MDADCGVWIFWMNIIMTNKMKHTRTSVCVMHVTWVQNCGIPAQRSFYIFAGLNHEKNKALIMIIISIIMLNFECRRVVDIFSLAFISLLSYLMMYSVQKLCKNKIYHVLLIITLYVFIISVIKEASTAKWHFCIWGDSTAKLEFCSMKMMVHKSCRLHTTFTTQSMLKIWNTKSVEDILRHYYCYYFILMNIVWWWWYGDGERYGIRTRWLLYLPIPICNVMQDYYHHQSFM